MPYPSIAHPTRALPVPRAQQPSRRARRWSSAALLTAVALVATSCGNGDTGTTASDQRTNKELARLDIMAPAAPGGGWDSTARAMGGAIEAGALARSVTVRNVEGAGGTIGLAQLANDRSEHSLMVMGLVMVGAIATNQAKVSLRDVTPIARLTAEDEVIVVPAASPYRTIGDLATALKSKGRAVTVTGGSAGGTDHIVAGSFAKAVGLPPANLNYIPYSGGGESLAALLGNKVQVGISGVSEYAEQIKAGKLRPLAVAGSKQVDGIDAPTLKESGYDVELANWRGVVAPGGLSKEARNRLVQLVIEMHDSDVWQNALVRNGWADRFLAGDEFDTFINTEIPQTEEVLKDLGLVK